MSNVKKVYTEVPTYEMIAGDAKRICFIVKKENGGDVDLTLAGTTIYFWLTHYEDDGIYEPVLTKTVGSGITVLSSQKNSYVVKLIEDDTVNLAGTFVYQTRVEDPNGNSTRPVEGVIEIRPARGRIS